MLFVVSGDVSFLEGPFLQILSLTHLYCCTLCILMWGCKPFLTIRDASREFISGPMGST